jgi:hypothetical protein
MPQSISVCVPAIMLVLLLITALQQCRGQDAKKSLIGQTREHVVPQRQAGTQRGTGSTGVDSLPGSPSECYLMNATQGAVVKDDCGRHNGSLLEDHYTLSPQGVTWNAPGSEIATDVTTFPRSVLACFTHEFGGTRYGSDVTRVFEKYPSLLTSDSGQDGGMSLEGQDGRRQGLNSANLGFLYFTERDGRKNYIAATKEGTNGGPHCLILNRVQSGGDKFYLDGSLLSMSYNASSSNGTLGSGHLVIGGRLHDGDSWFNGTLHLLVLWDDETLATQTAVNRAMAWANNQLRLKGLPPAGSRPFQAGDFQSRFIIVGDSITECGGLAQLDHQKCWAENIKLKNPAVLTVPVAMGGLSGQFAAVTSPWREATLLDPKAPFNVAQFYYGVNDGCRNQYSEDQIWQRAIQWSRYMHTLGVRTLFTTMIDVGNSSNCGPNNEPGAIFKKNLNAIARDHYQGAFDGIVDFASYPDLGADGSSEGRCFQADHVHPNAVCQRQMVQMTEDSVNYILDPGPIFISSSIYAMNGGDKTVVLSPSIATESTVTLPSCFGKTGMPYTIANGSTPAKKFKLTLVPRPDESIFGVNKQTLTIAPGTSATMVSIVSDVSKSGCTWIRM